MYLVLLRCLRDDLPLRMFNNREDALAFVKKWDGEIPGKVEDMFNAYNPDQVCLFIVRFKESLHGWKPRSADCVRSLDNEPDPTEAAQAE